jgi:hypothetical protein
MPRSTTARSSAICSSVMGRPQACWASATASQMRRQVLNLWRGDQMRSISGLALRLARGLV